MKYYDEAKMHDIRLRLEKEVLSWPNVTTRKMYGCPCYKNQNRLFAFLVTDGVVLTKVDEQELEALGKEHQLKPFQAGKRTMKGWPQISVERTTDLDRLIPLIRRSYQLSKP